MTSSFGLVEQAAAKILPAKPQYSIHRAGCISFVLGTTYGWGLSSFPEDQMHILAVGAGMCAGIALSNKLFQERLPALTVYTRSAIAGGLVAGSLALL